MRHNPGSPYEAFDDAALAAHGIPSPEELIAFYCERTGRPGVENLDFYYTYNLFRSACILQGIMGRVRDGTAASAHASDYDTVRPIAERAMEFGRRAGA